MIDKIKKLLRVIEAGRIFNSSPYLAETGWWRSYRAKLPLDKDGQPIPWVTYSFIDFITNRITDDLIIFEFGSGNSTFFYASKAKKVVSVEHDESWYMQIRDKTPANADILYQVLEYGGEYCKTMTRQPFKFDIVVVDGRDRVNCMLNAVEGLTETGVVVLDDSERTAYQKGIEFLVDGGFRRLDFWGIAPGLAYRKCTTVFYKQNNCLQI